jgi:Tol biopolymer transport system component
VDWSPDNRKLIVHDFGGKAGKVGLIDVQTGERRLIMDGSKRVVVPHMSPDKR